VNNLKHLDKPFGGNSFEEEIKIYGPEYQDYYFNDTSFNKDALDRNVYLIIGRKGSGKSSLGNFFNSQKEIKSSKTKLVLNEHLYIEIINYCRNAEIKKIADIIYIWEGIIFSIIGDNLIDADNTSLEKLLLRTDVNIIIKSTNKKKPLISKPISIPTNNDEYDYSLMENLKSDIYLITHNSPFILVIDSLEKYNVDDEYEMKVISALIETSYKINLESFSNNISIKVMLAAEVSSYITERYMTNNLKYFQNPLHLIWKPKGLLFMLCYKFYEYLKDKDMIKYEKNEINWNNNSDVLEKIWNPYFGKTLFNANQIEESSFNYVLRHTQLRPRQLVYLCNEIAGMAIKNDNFPIIDSHIIVNAVSQFESHLAHEIINSYIDVYPNLNEILIALKGISKIFLGSELDKRAPRTKDKWSFLNYSPENFRKMLTEIGLIGIVQTQITKSNIDVLFEYTQKGRLQINDDDYCAIHPMFYNYLNVKTQDDPRIIYPITEITTKRS
jgi:hypothetical protein